MSFTEPRLNCAELTRVLTDLTNVECIKAFQLMFKGCTGGRWFGNCKRCTQSAELSGLMFYAQDQSSVGGH